MKRIILSLTCIALLLMPAAAFAQGAAQRAAQPVDSGAETEERECGLTDPECLLGVQDNTGSILPANPSYAAPISDVAISGKDLFKLITRFVLGFVGSVALLILVIGGFMYVTARGDEGQVEKAKNAIIGAVIGIIIILASWTIVTTVLNVSERRGGNQYLPGDNTKTQPKNP